MYESCSLNYYIFLLLVFSIMLTRPGTLHAQVVSDTLQTTPPDTLPEQIQPELPAAPADTLPTPAEPGLNGTAADRSEERRVGKECRAGWSQQERTKQRQE